MCSHLWLANLADSTVEVFATAFTLSAKKRGYRVSTRRFLAALPEAQMAQMARLLREAGSECKMGAAPEDLPAPELPADWQEKICFSTCVESTLLKCGPHTDLVAFLKLLCVTAVHLHCIVDRSMPLDEYLTPLEAASQSSFGCPTPMIPDRWLTHDPAPLAVADQLDRDALRIIMSKSSSIEVLRNCKAVCTSWRQEARQTLCDVDWLLHNQVSIHTLLKKGDPSPDLVLALADKQPALVHERDGEGLLPLQYAAAYRMGAGLIAVLRKITAAHVPGSAAWANSIEARSIKSHLRPVRTRVGRAPIGITA